MVVHGAGRIPNIKELDLTKTGVEYSSIGKVKDYLQSISNSYLYAADDVVDNGGLPLTPVVASYDGIIVSNDLLNGNVDKTNYSGLPSVAFTIAAIASVGFNEKEAKERGLRYRCINIRIHQNGIHQNM
jgi:glutathione reductase (NADPH)